MKYMDLKSVDYILGVIRSVFNFKIYVMLVYVQRNQYFIV